MNQRQSTAQNRLELPSSLYTKARLSAEQRTSIISSLLRAGSIPRIQTAFSDVLSTPKVQEQLQSLVRSLVEAEGNNIHEGSDDITAKTEQQVLAHVTQALKAGLGLESASFTGKKIDVPGGNAAFEGWVEAVKAEMQRIGIAIEDEDDD